ncbi:MAG: hypothetical protein KBC69_03635 [Candidatus Magasanikbacteria bacterium]|nr:hypothetical protein [Candidatus Magasanikbacteria bacterium]
MTERVRGGWEGKEGKLPYFDDAKNFDEIINTFNIPALANIKEINPVMVLQARAEYFKGWVLSPATIAAIPEDYGLREAVVRAMAPDFSQDQDLELIMRRLSFVLEQNKPFVGLQDRKGYPLSVFKTSSGVPIAVESYIASLQNVMAFLNNPNTKNHADAYDMVQTFGLTSSGGFKDAVSRAVLKVLAQANERTGPIPKI